MEFSAETVAQELDKRWGGVTITDGPNGPIEIRAAVRLGQKRVDMINDVSRQIDKLRTPPMIEGPDGEPIEDPEFQQDQGMIFQLGVDALALRCDDPQGFREWLAARPEDDQPAICILLQNELNNTDQGESEA